MIRNIKKAKLFVDENLWNIRLDKVSNKRQGFFLRSLRVFALATKGFNEDNCLTKASALTFYILLSIVPILALAFALSKGFGLEKELQANILQEYGEYKDVLGHAFNYADKMLAETKGGIMAVVGALLLLFSVINLLSNIENSFNDIWNVSKARTWYRKVTDYLTIMLIAPIFIVASGSLTVMLQTQNTDVVLLSHANTLLIKILALAFVCGMFTFLFMVLPNTRVQFKSAFIAALVTAILFELIQWAYITFQIGVNRLNAIYGGFAALPLFLIWVQYSWYIVLYGAELAYAIQNVAHFELESEIKKISVRYKRVIAILICNLVVKNFLAGKKALTMQEIIDKLDLPHRLANLVVTELIESRILSEVKTEIDKEVAFQPAVSDSLLTVKYVIDKLDHKGVNELPMASSAELATIKRLMTDLDTALSNDKGKLLIRDIA
jgi:membrane protein